MDDFRQRLIAFSVKAVALSPRCTKEEITKNSLVLPFLAALGYDDRDPSEVCPEHSADFSEKYKNRVDYAILKNEQPVIAIECKTFGAPLRDERGQLRSYFNAAPTVKMGVLTDGIIYEFYADADEPNMMDQTAFLTIDLRQVAKGQIDDLGIDGLRNLQKAEFNAENIGADARRKLVFKKVLEHISDLAENPSADFTRETMAVAAGIKNIHKDKLPEYRDMMRAAFSQYINVRILRRLDIPTADADKKAIPEAVNLAIEQVGPAKVEESRGASEIEMAVLAAVKHRLAFLVKDEALFNAINDIGYRDYQGKFVVFFKRERKGRLFDLVEGSKPALRMSFGEGVAEVTGETIADLCFDAPILAAFTKRVEEESAGKKGEDEAPKKRSAEVIRLSASA